jgi:ribose-phosphate pyrophosphokinase
MLGRGFHLAASFVAPLSVLALAHAMPPRPKTSHAAEKFHSPFIQDLTQRSKPTRRSDVTKESMMLISGSVHKELNEAIAENVGIPLAKTSISRFADGEVSVQIDENVRGRHVFVVQSCAAPVNDNILELLLTVAAVRRSSASRVTAVIPYFGYKHHRYISFIGHLSPFFSNARIYQTNSFPLSMTRRWASKMSSHDSRFLSSAAMDFAKMLTVIGVDRVIAVDLQRPGQGGEACFFDNSIPLESIVTTG